MSSLVLTHISAHTPLIEQCAYRIFSSAASSERPSDHRRRARIRAAALDPDRVEQGSAHAPRVPFAIGRWLAYLLWLEATLHLITPRAIADVTAAEVSGLRALSRARHRFTANHSFCPQCEAPNPRGAARCRHCPQEF